MFGLTVSEYPELVRCKKELGLLQKLYGLYNAVIDTINGYYDILWTEVDIEKINGELMDFQNRLAEVSPFFRRSFETRKPPSVCNLEILARHSLYLSSLLRTKCVCAKRLVCFCRTRGKQTKIQKSKIFYTASCLFRCICDLHSKLETDLQIIVMQTKCMYGLVTLTELRLWSVPGDDY